MTVHERPFGRYFEDFEVGDVCHWPGKTITGPPLAASSSSAEELLRLVVRPCQRRP